MTAADDAHLLPQKVLWSSVTNSDVNERHVPPIMPGFHHSVAVIPLPFRRSTVVKFHCSVKIT